ncbi:formylglycine-generating enzyme required for sulfatase activity [Povalibacter uvarum]|uniref:Formylglycine-generating enzyme required for sulfatase activity n=1 Tax=Povalibacter uvarum TaxID=732238 RepID=A0A841HKM9_9GAMM|nr:SUMF1/EgtB/PvdO family nonheme iron enzyme [Povalibacter uvarum]MBB6093293.1 formylglycine-generating enzyme required for sulfatase activity [Povalibacter uvarum]
MRTLRLAGSMLILLGTQSCTSGAPREATRECEFCPEMVVVPHGVGIVGASATDRFRNPDELPERRFQISESFAVSRYEVTRAQYEAFVRATGQEIRGECLTDRAERGKWVMDETTTFRDPGFSQTDDHPAACVNWDEAKAYIAWLNTRTQGGYRMLTEVEWEYLARAGTTRNDIYPWGNEESQGCDSANGFDQTTLTKYAGIDTSGYKTFDPLSCRDGWLNTAPVGSLAANAFGVYDLIGNVAEWVEDCTTPSHESLSESGAPPAIEGACARRVTKGGSWGTLAHNLRIAERIPYPATHRDDSIGIRVARTLR